jgi:hypothetical protein
LAFNGTGKVLKKQNIARSDPNRLWEDAYSQKNKFYRNNLQEAVRYVEQFKTGKEFLDAGKIADFWHEHCDF